jgi:hypothetical protein
MTESEKNPLERTESASKAKSIFESPSHGTNPPQKAVKNASNSNLNSSESKKPVTSNDTASNEFVKPQLKKVGSNSNVAQVSSNPVEPEFASVKLKKASCKLSPVIYVIFMNDSRPRLMLPKNL